MCGEDNEEKAGKVGGRIVRVWEGEWEEWTERGRRCFERADGKVAWRKKERLGERRSGLEKEGA
jgi:hypothetical protein